LNKSTCSRRPNKQPAGNPGQLSNNLFARPAGILTVFLPNELEMVLEEDRDVVVYDRWRYIVEHKVLVLSIWHPNEAISDRDLWSAGQEDSKSNRLQRLSCTKKVYDNSDIVVIIALIKRVNDKNVCGLATILAQLR
jgi:hypothetical protein